MFSPEGKSSALPDLSPLAFSSPVRAGRELEYVNEVLASGKWGGNGRFSDRCAKTLCKALGVQFGLMTHSCTAALEMATILARLQPGDEVILPSFTFVSTANAVVLRGAVPVFVDIRPDTLNLDENLIESAVTPRTRAIIAVHYAGVCCAMDEILAVARRHGLLVIEDAAQAYLSTYRGRPAGSLGDMAAFSFHETKNVTSGEGGVFVTGNQEIAERAEIVWEKGTNRSRMLRGEVSKYSWVDIGSSFLPSELVAAVLLAQLEEAPRINARRQAIWKRYYDGFASLERDNRARRPIVPPECGHNGHLFYLLLPDARRRDALIAGMRARGIAAPFHYIPLHSSAAGQRYGRVAGELPFTTDLSARLIRMPLHIGLRDEDVERVIAAAVDLTAADPR
jgi:dTDP-4-amino-4,6-dideoxygalactose transaminase